MPARGRLGDGHAGTRQRGYTRRVGTAGRPLPAILAHDADHGTEYSKTLATYLDHFGEPQRAALALHIHPNTLRYRMHRLADVTPIDLTSPQVRLALRLQLAALN